jgi:hypothetical protein
MLGVIVSLSLKIDTKNKTISNFEYEKLAQTDIANNMKRQFDSVFQQNQKLAKQILDNNIQHEKELKDWQNTYNELKEKFDILVNPPKPIIVDEVILPKKVTSSKPRKKKVLESNS